MIDSRLETITPEMAKEYLKTSLGNPRYANKLVNENYVKMLAADMKEGRWETTHQGIAFNEEGHLIDGHHRLKAIVVANLPIKMMITRGVPGNVYNIDTGSKRTTSQINVSRGMSGIYTDFRMVAVSKLAVLRLKYKKTKVNTRGITNNESYEYISRNFNEMKWLSAIANRGSSHSKIRKSPVLYAFLIAYITLGEKEKAKLERAAEVIATGYSECPNEKVLIIAKNKLEEYRGSTPASCSDIMCAYAQTALYKYLNGDGDVCKINKLITPYEDYYFKYMRSDEFGVDDQTEEIANEVSE